MSEQKMLVNKLLQVQQQQNILEKQEEEIKKRLVVVLKKAGTNTAEGNAISCKIALINEEVYAKNSCEVMPAEKLASVIYEKILQGEVSIEKLIDLFNPKEQQVIKQGLQNCGAMKIVSKETLVVSKKN